MKELIILTPDGQENTVYHIEDLSLKNLCSQLFSQISACIDIQTPEYSHLYKVIASPIKILKNKNNKHLNTSLKLSVNEFVYECFMQKSEDLQKTWHNMCEDFMQINISHNLSSNDSLTYTFYAIKNSCNENKQFQFFIKDTTLPYLKESTEQISYFLNANQLRHDYSTIYKNILQKKSFEDFCDSLEKSSLKQEISSNQAFIFSCLYYYSNPAYFLTNLLGNNLIEAKWKNGIEFLESFSSYFDRIPLNIVSPLIDHYERFILNTKLQNCLPINYKKTDRKKI